MNYLKMSILCCVALMLSSCEKEGLYTYDSEDVSLQDSVILKQGTFSPTSGITVNGKAEIRQHATEVYVQLKDFSISSGPDLKVYLSKTDTPTQFVNLGALENNKFVYQIPQGVVVSEYPFVLIHCQQYNHLFAIAHLN